MLARRTYDPKRAESDKRIGASADAQAAAFRARRLQTIVDVAPWMMLSNLLNALISLYFSIDAWPKWMAIAWCCSVVGVASMGLPLWWKTRRRPLAACSSRTTSKVLLHGIVLAVLWAMIPALAFLSASHPAQLFIVGMTAGMLCGGALTLAPIPKAANAYVAVLATGAVVGLLQTDSEARFPMLAVLMVYVGVLFAVTASLARSFEARLMAEAAAAHQQELVSLLLNDFQEHTSDWFWETNAEGKLCNVSSRLVAVLDLPADQLEGRGFVGLLVEYSDEADHSVANLDEFGRLQLALLEDKPFHGLQLSVIIKGTWRRWLISGKPLFGKCGAVIGWRGVGSDITATHEAHVEVRRLATTDEVTGLANRHAFKRALQRVSQEPAALIYLDLDNFKGINDVHGHAMGDGVLLVVAQRLKECVRATDLLARVGGDEFAVLRFGNIDRRELEQDAKRFCEVLAQPCTVGSLRFVLGTSIGLALAPKDADTGETLLRCTDLAVYEAKDAGRGTWRFYKQELGERAARRNRLQDDLRDGLKLDQFSVHFQPQFHAADGHMIGAEALLRWNHPERGEVSPSEFITAAEESGVIGALGGWVLQRACEAAMHWPATMHVAVNVSAQQLVQPNWVRQVRDILAATKLAPERLELELTETALIENTAAAMSAIVRLRTLGVRIALDDFGTGYSSLAYLRRFPFDKIKIDQSFVVGITRDPSALAIVTAVTRLATALKLEITAEGVENNEQTMLLRELGCSSLQGYLLARPMPDEQLRQYVFAEHVAAEPPRSSYRHIGPIAGSALAS